MVLPFFNSYIAPIIYNRHLFRPFIFNILKTNLLFNLFFNIMKFYIFLILPEILLHLYSLPLSFLITLPSIPYFSVRGFNLLQRFHLMYCSDRLYPNSPKSLQIQEVPLFYQRILSLRFHAPDIQSPQRKCGRPVLCLPSDCEPSSSVRQGQNPF